MPWKRWRCAEAGFRHSGRVSIPRQTPQTGGGLPIREVAAARVEARIRREAGSRGLSTGGVLNPGDPGLDILEQRTVVGLARGDSIGVSVTGGGMLSPVKSLTFIMGIGFHLPAWDRAANCMRCPTRHRCVHRQGNRRRVT